MIESRRQFMELLAELISSEGLDEKGAMKSDPDRVKNLFKIAGFDKPTDFELNCILR